MIGLCKDTEAAGWNIRALSRVSVSVEVDSLISAPMFSAIWPPSTGVTLFDFRAASFRLLHPHTRLQPRAFLCVLLPPQNAV